MLGARVDQGTIAMKGFFAFPKASASLQLHHQIFSYHIEDSRWGVLCRGAVGVFYSPSRLSNVNSHGDHRNIAQPMKSINQPGWFKDKTYLDLIWGTILSPADPVSHWTQHYKIVDSKQFTCIHTDMLYNLQNQQRRNFSQICKSLITFLNYVSLS